MKQNVISDVEPVIRKALELAGRKVTNATTPFGLFDESSSEGAADHKTPNCSNEYTKTKSVTESDRYY